MLKIIDTETGEIIREIEPGDKIIKKRARELLTTTMEFKKGENFIKLYTSILNDLLEEELSGPEWQVVIVCLKHLSYESGAIKYLNTGDFLTPGDIMRETKLGRATVFRCIDELTERKILHKGKTGKEFQLYANPYLFVKGTRINKTLYDMFKKTKWAKKHKNELEVEKY